MTAAAATALCVTFLILPLLVHGVRCLDWLPSPLSSPQPSRDKSVTEANAGDRFHSYNQPKKISLPFLLGLLCSDRPPFSSDSCSDDVPNLFDISVDYSGSPVPGPPGSPGTQLNTFINQSERAPPGKKFLALGSLPARSNGTALTLRFLCSFDRVSAQRHAGPFVGITF
jgi:hypothetical protein